MRALQAIANKNPEQKNGTKLILENIEYVVIRRVADTSVAAGNELYKLYTDAGETDISRQYQIYVPDLVNGKPNPNKYLPFKDGTVADATHWGLPDPTTYVSGKNSTDGSDIVTPMPGAFNTSPNGVAFSNSNYQSSPCLGTPSNGTTSDGILPDTLNSAGE